jgi:NadR type nicotinamide-nucleotide adenylyltransferase
VEKENTTKVSGLSTRKVVIIGPESTGKSTLSQALARELHTVWVPEYAREYLEAREDSYQESDLLEIAKGQIRTEDEYLARANDTLICDTDLNVIKVWSEHNYRRCNRWVLEQIAERRYDLYLLTYIDIPWQDDPLREHHEDNMRRYFYEQYRDIVMHSGVKWADVRGDMTARLSTALHAVRLL